MIHIGECTQLPAQYELDQCSAVEVLSSSSRHKKTLRRFVEVLLSSRSTTSTADLPKFFSLKIYIKHCRFVEVLLSSRSTTSTADLPKFFSLKIYITHCRFVEVLLSSRSTTSTADLPKFFPFKIYIKHCRFVEVLLSSRSATNTVDLSKFFSLQAPQQTLQICQSSSLFKIHKKHCILDDSSEQVQKRLVLSLAISQQLRMAAMRYLVHACVG
jgi:hypothetical protein